jgi:hypothetical protein
MYAAPVFNRVTASTNIRKLSVVSCGTPKKWGYCSLAVQALKAGHIPLDEGGAWGSREPVIFAKRTSFA